MRRRPCVWGPGPLSPALPEALHPAAARPRSAPGPSAGEPAVISAPRSPRTCNTQGFPFGSQSRPLQIWNLRGQRRTPAPAPAPAAWLRPHCPGGASGLRVLAALTAGVCSASPTQPRPQRLLGTAASPRSPGDVAMGCSGA